MKIFWQILIISGLLIPARGLSQEVFQEQTMYPALLRFDQGYISALLHARKGEVGKAKQAIFFLEYQWQRTAYTYAAMLPPDHGNQEQLDRATEWLADAYLAIDNNNPVFACSALENAQLELRQLRRDHNISFFFDPWYELDEQLLAVRDILSDPMLKLEEWETLCARVEACAEQWANLSGQAIQPGVFGWSREKFQQYNKQLQATSGKIRMLQRAIDTAEHSSEAVRAASEAYEAFLANLSMFGAFSSPKLFFAETPGAPAGSKIQAL